MALAVSAFALSFAPPRTIGPPWLLALLVVLSLAWVVLQPAATRRDDVLPAFAIMLSAVGLLLVARVSPLLAHKQQYWLLISLALAIAYIRIEGQRIRFAEAGVTLPQRRSRPARIA